MVSSRVLSRAPAPPKAGGARYERKGWLVFPGLRRGRPAPPAEFGARAPVSGAARVWTRRNVPDILRPWHLGRSARVDALRGADGAIGPLERLDGAGRRHRADRSAWCGVGRRALIGSTPAPSMAWLRRTPRPAHRRGSVSTHRTMSSPNCPGARRLKIPGGTAARSNGPDTP